MVSRALPFIRRESVRLVKESHPTQEEGVRAIEEGLRNFYRTQDGSIDQQALTRTVGAVQEVYRRNVFPAMKVTWGSYPDNKGHMTSNGCFRCHDDSHEAKDGSKISGDCELLPQTARNPALKRSGRPQSSSFMGFPSRYDLGRRSASAGGANQSFFATTFGAAGSSM